MSEPLERVEQKLGDVERKLAVMESKLDAFTSVCIDHRATLGKDLVRLCSALTELTGTVQGNGQPGLRLLVDRHEQQLREAQWFKRVVVVALLGQTVALIFT